jgi:hypothetical protein
MKKSAERFPSAMLAMTSHAPEASDTRPTEIALTAGAVAARQWINSLYGLVTAPEVHFGVELCAGYKPGKAEFAALLDRITKAFEPMPEALGTPHLYGFRRDNGTDQLRGRPLSVHTAYGFWSYLRDIADEFDLWAVLEKQNKAEAEAGYALSENQKAFVRSAKRAGLRVDYGYSGRCMYGRHCPSVTVPRVSDFRTRARVSADNMGMDMVVYAAE